MPIKPLERKNNWSIFIKLMFLGGLVVSAVIIDKVFFKKIKETPSVLGETKEIKSSIQESNLVKDSINKAEKVGGVVLGVATDTMNKLASDAGSFVSNVIYDNSIGKVIEQVDKLPKDQQEKIREQICK